MRPPALARVVYSPHASRITMLGLALLIAGCRGNGGRPDDALADSLAAALAGHNAAQRTPPTTDTPTIEVEVETEIETTPSNSTTAATRSLEVCLTPDIDAAPGTRIVEVFLTCGEEAAPVRRSVADTRGVLRAALDELLRGPTEEETRAGFRSFFSRETAGMLESVVVGDDGSARISFVDFSAIIPNASSSAGSQQLLDQLRGTIFQYRSVREATIGFNGDCEAFWNWLQRGCQPLRPEAG